MTTITVEPYKVTATLNGRTIATAIRTAWGWHIPKRPALVGDRYPKRVTWETRDSVKAVVDAFELGMLIAKAQR